MSEISASLFHEVEQQIKETIDSSEIVTMVIKHFDNDSAMKMIDELKKELKDSLEYVLMGSCSDEYEDDEEE